MDEETGQPKKKSFLKGALKLAFKVAVLGIGIGIGTEIFTELFMFSFFHHTNEGMTVASAATEFFKPFFEWTGLTGWQDGGFMASALEWFKGVTPGIHEFFGLAAEPVQDVIVDAAQQAGQSSAAVLPAGLDFDS